MNACLSDTLTLMLLKQECKPISWLSAIQIDFLCTFLSVKSAFVEEKEKIVRQMKRRKKTAHREAIIVVWIANITY